MDTAELYFHKETFEKIPSEKKERIFQVAAEAFSSLGYTAANINDIAKKAGISIGSMYSYFSAKENLFLAVVERGYGFLEEAMAELNPKEGSVMAVLRRLICITINYSKKYPHMGKLYHSLTTEELSKLSERLSRRLEIDFKGIYEDLLKRGMDAGEVRKDLNVPITAFYLDNLIVMLELSFSSTYYQFRLKEYLNQEADEEQNLIEGLLSLISKSICNQS